jgi:branched-chain amino acid aminotransferase
MEVNLAAPEQLKPKPDVDSMQFGKYFTDHMMRVEFNKAKGGWQTPEIMPFQNISLHPAAKVFHYAVEVNWHLGRFIFALASSSLTLETI